MVDAEIQPEISIMILSKLMELEDVWLLLVVAVNLEMNSAGWTLDAE